MRKRKQGSRPSRPCSTWPRNLGSASTSCSGRLEVINSTHYGKKGSQLDPLSQHPWHLDEIVCRVCEENKSCTPPAGAWQPDASQRTALLVEGT